MLIIFTLPPSPPITISCPLKPFFSQVPTHSQVLCACENLLNSIGISYMSMNGAFFTETWATYQWSYDWRKLYHLFQQSLTACNSSGVGRVLWASLLSVIECWQTHIFWTSSESTHSFCDTVNKYSGHRLSLKTSVTAPFSTLWPLHLSTPSFIISSKHCGDWHGCPT